MSDVGYCNKCKALVKIRIDLLEMTPICAICDNYINEYDTTMEL